VSSGGWRFPGHENSTRAQYIRYLADSLDASRTTSSVVALYCNAPFNVRNVPILLWLRKRCTGPLACNDAFRNQNFHRPRQPLPLALRKGARIPMYVAVILKFRDLVEWKMLSLGSLIRQRAGQTLLMTRRVGQYSAKSIIASHDLSRGPRQCATTYPLT
jgi:hypothetical protein